MSTHPELRIGDREREAAATALGEHFAEGRIDREEYDERSAVVWSARTAADLRPVFADLPGPHHAALGRARPALGPAPAGLPRRTSPTSSGGFRVPLLPLLLIVVGVAVLVNGWPVLLVAGLFWFVVVRRIRHRVGGLCRPQR